LEIAQGMMQNGKGAEALALLDTLGRTLRIKAQEVNADTLIAIDTEDSIREILAKSKKDIETGYKVRYDDMEVNGPGTGRKPEALSLPSGALTIIAARTSHRKTGLMLNMALNIAQRNREDVPGDVYFLTYEEDAAELYVKALNIYIDADLDHNNLDYIRSYYRKSHQNRDSDVFMTRKESFYHDLVTTGRLKIKGLDGTFTSTTLAAAVDNMMRVAKPAPAVLFVDYIQLIGTDRDIENRQAKLAQVCTELRELAKRVGIPVVLGAQFNRQVGQEGDIESSKIREAGDIEHEANLVIGLWDRAFTREGKTETKNGKQTTTGGHLDRNGNPAKKQPGTLYVEVLKGRNIGTGGYAELTYNPKTGKIYPYVADGGHGLGGHSNPNKPLSKHDKARG
jgi:replicative DNA helicase